MRAFVIVLVFAVATILLQVLGKGNPEAGNWGVHHYGLLPGIWFAVGGAGAALLLLLGGLRGAGLGKIRLPAALAAILIAAAGAVLYWVAQERAFFLGGGYYWIEQFTRGAPAWYLEPGAVLSLSALDRLLGGDPAHTLALVSVGCGFAFLLLSFIFARDTAESGWGRALVFGLLALAGLTRLFAGYVETHALSAVVVLLYLVLTVRYVRGRGSVAGPVILGTLAPLFYPAALLLLPSLVYALLRGPSREARGGAKPASAGTALRLAALAVPVIVLGAAALVLWRHAFSLRGTLDYALGDLLPLGASNDPTVAYSLLSGAHLRDFFQEQMLLGPFGALFALVMLVLGASGRLGREGRFLLWAGLPWWIFTFLANHDLGAAREWGSMAAATLPFLLLAGLALARVPWSAHRPRLAGIMAGLVLATSFFHLLPSMGVSMNAERSLAQMALLFGPGSSASPFARSYAYEEIGAWYMEHGLPDAAVTALREAADADTTNIRAAGNLAGLLVRQGETAEAALVLETSARRAPHGELLYFQLGNAYRNLGQFDDAAGAYTAALDIAPKFVDGYRALSEVELARGNPAGARDALVKAWELAPQDTEILARLAAAYEAVGDVDPAEQIYRDLLALAPENAGAAFNLGRILIDKQQYEEAARWLAEVVRLQPTDAEAWTNLGVAQGELGRREEATAALERAIGLAPALPEAYFNLTRLSLVAGDTTRAIELMHSYAALDSTSDWAKLARNLLIGMGAGSP